jgi:hypothetical protein
MLLSLAILFFWRVFLFVRCKAKYKKHDKKIKFMCVGNRRLCVFFAGKRIFLATLYALAVKGRGVCQTKSGVGLLVLIERMIFV